MEQFDLGPSRRVIAAGTVGLIVLVVCAVTASAVAKAAGVSSRRVQASGGKERLVKCVSDYGLANGPSGMDFYPLAVPGPAVEGFAYYSDATLRLPAVLAPREWRCHVELGNDGSVLLVVSPQPITLSEMSLVEDGRVRAPVVSFYFSSVCSGCIYGAACGAIATVAPWRGFGDCNENPPEQRKEVSELRKEGTKITAETVVFSDPANVHGIGWPSGGRFSAVGVVVYDAYRRTLFTEAAIETCAVPANMAHLCSPITTNFVRRHWILP